VRGLRVGHDISIIGGNNTPGLLSVPYPHLATFDIHARKIAALAVRQLAIQIAEHSRPKNLPALMPYTTCQLVVKPTFLPGDSICDLRAVNVERNGHASLNGGARQVI
jgi:DNA-binding LacI/PurR family transcriptional regulator